MLMISKISSINYDKDKYGRDYFAGLRVTKRNKATPNGFTNTNPTPNTNSI